jgi:hypothetical protein
MPLNLADNNDLRYDEAKREALAEEQEAAKAYDPFDVSDLVQAEQADGAEAGEAPEGGEDGYADWGITDYIAPITSPQGRDLLKQTGRDTLVSLATAVDKISPYVAGGFQSQTRRAVEEGIEGPKGTAGEVGGALGRSAPVVAAALATPGFIGGALASATMSGLTFSKEDATLGTVIEEATGVPIPSGIEEDDSDLEVFVKNFGEDAAFSAVTGGLGKALAPFAQIAKNSRRLRTAAGAADDLPNNAMDDLARATEDAAVGAEYLDRLTEARAKLDVDAPASPTLTPAGRVGDDVFPLEGSELPSEVLERAERGYLDSTDPENVVFRTAEEGDEMLGTAREAAEEHEALAVGLEEFARVLDDEIAVTSELTGRANARLLEAAEGSPSRVAIEHARQAARAHPDIDRRLGELASQAPGAAEAARLVRASRTGRVGPLEVTDENVDAAVSAIERGDYEGRAEALSRDLDRNNYAKIYEENGTKDILAGLADETAGNAGSNRLYNQKDWPTSNEEARELLTDLAVDGGGDINRAIAAMQEMMPQHDLATQVRAMQTFRIALSKKTEQLAAELATTDARITARAELAAVVRATAQANDMAMGLASQMGRGMNILRQGHKSAGFEDVLSLAPEIERNARDVVASVGGDEAIDLLAAQIRAQGGNERGVRRVIARSDIANSTLGDLVYESHIMATLSSPITISRNVASNTAMAAGIYPAQNLFSSGAVAIWARDAGALRSVGADTIGRLRGAAGALWMDGNIRLSRPWEGFGGGTAFQAGKQRQKLTGGRRIKFAGQEQASARVSAEGVEGFLRNQAPVTIPFTGGRGRLPLLTKKAGARAARRIAPRLDPKTNKMKVGMGARAIDWFGKSNTWPAWALAWGDEFAASINYNGRLWARVAEDAFDRGLRGPDADQYIRKTVDEVLAKDETLRGLDPFDPEYAQKLEHIQGLERFNKAAEDAADWGTFTQQPGPVTEAVLKLRKVLPASRWVAKFITTPANLMRTGARDLTPIGELGEGIIKGTESEIGKGGVDRARALGRLAFASSFSAAMYGLVSEGKTTGGGPANPAEREIWRAEGNEPYTIQINGESYKYDWADPVMIPVALFSDLHEAFGRMDEPTWDKISLQVVSSMLEIAKSRTYLQGSIDFVNMLQDPGRYYERMLVNQAKLMVPQQRLGAAIARGGLPMPEGLMERDPTDSGTMKLFKEFTTGDKRRASIDKSRGTFITLSDTVREDLPPGLREIFTETHNMIWDEKLAHGRVPQLDFFGDTILYPNGFGPDMASPVSVSTRDENPAAAEMARLGINVSTSSRFEEYAGIMLSPEQRHDYQMAFAKPKDGIPIADLIEKEIAKDSYQRLGDTVGDDKGGKAAKLQRLIGRRMEKAGRLLEERYVALKTARLDKRAEKRALRSKEGSDKVRKQRQEQLPQLLRQLSGGG